MRPIALLVHANPTVLERFETGLGCPVHLVLSHGSQFSAGYDGLGSDADVVQQAPTLDRAVAKHAPGADAGSPVVLVTYSAGTWAGAVWLRQPDARIRCKAAVFLDGIHSKSSVHCAGILDFARMALAGERVLVISHSAIKPPYTSSTETVDFLLAQLGRSRPSPRDDFHEGGLHIRAYPGTDGPAHAEQLRSIGPALCAQYVLPVVRELQGRADTEPTLVSPAMPLGLRALAWSREELRQHGRPSAARRAAYFEPALREGADGKPRPLGLSDGNWCAAGACYATRQVTQDGEAVPHLYRASGLELERDAVRAGAWLPVLTVRRGDESPEPGDLIVLHRGHPSTWETSWQRHVGRVASKLDAAGRFLCLDANGAGAAWHEVERVLDASAIRGFARYPRGSGLATEPPPPPEGHDAALERLAELALAQVPGLDWDAWRLDRDALVQEDTDE